MKLFHFILLTFSLYSLNLFAKSEVVMSKLNIKCKNQELFLNQHIMLDGTVVNLTENHFELKNENENVFIKSEASNDWLNFGKIKKANTVDCSSVDPKSLVVDFEINKTIGFESTAQKCQVRSIKIPGGFETVWFRPVMTRFTVEVSAIALSYEKKYSSFYSCFIDPKFFKN